MECTISVIIPFYKNKNWLIEAIESVKQQVFEDYEIIIVNDGSTEDISDLESEYSSIRFFTIMNSGPGRARNFGIDASLGKYLAFLDSDDMWTSDKLSVQVEFMDRNNLIWSHSNYIKFWDNKTDTKKINCKMEGYIIPQMFLSCPIATPCVMIRGEVLRSNLDLRFAENTRIGEDSFFWFKMAENYPLGFIDKHLTRVRIRGYNAALQAYLQLKSRADNYEFIKTGEVYYKRKIDFHLVKWGFFMCKQGYNFVYFLSTSLKINEGFREFISKCIYVFPLMYLKVISLFLRNNKIMSSSYIK